MNECEHISIGTCKILSKEKSNSFNSGSLIVQGGIGCGENLNVKNSVLCNDIGLNDSVISFENNNYLKFYNNIIPNNNSISIGSQNDPWYSIFSKNLIFKNSLVGNNVNIQNLNVDTNCLLGSNSILLKKGIHECLLDIDSRNNIVTFKSPKVSFKDTETKEDIMNINTDNIEINSVLNIKNENNVMISFNPYDRRALINGDLFVASNIIRSFKKITINCSDELNLDSEINLLKLEANHDLKLNLSVENLTIGVTRKIIIYNNTYEISINIENLVNLKEINSGAEFLFDGKKWILIGKF
mgnify:CR=1 FL=1